MDVKELRIGNLIYDEDGFLSMVIGFAPLEHSIRCDEGEGCEVLIDIFKKRGWDSGYVCESMLCDPILLTKSFLNEHGYPSSYDGVRIGDKINIHFESKTINIYIEKMDDDIELELPKYVHELQNLIFALHKEEIKFNF